MPNQRDKDKKFVGAWLRGKLYAAVKRTARQRKISVSEWVTEQLTDAANNPALLSELEVHDAISEVSEAPPAAPADYKSKPKVARRSKRSPAPGSNQ